MERRSDWLKSLVDELGLDNVTVRRARAEEVGDVFDIATARAVSALPKLLRLCVPLVRNGGEVLALKGSKASEEIDEAKRLQKKLGLAGFEIVHAGRSVLDEPTLVVRTKLV
jgi:16S rRNA (guanine527-N7)-methyltransferase